MPVTIQEIAAIVAQEFIPIVAELTRSDLQGCVGAAVSKYNLIELQAWNVEELALELIDQAWEDSQK